MPNDHLPAGSAPRRLDVREQVTFTWHFGTVQRIGWGVMVAIVLLGLSGVLGSGGVFSRRAFDGAEVPVVMRVGRVEHLKVFSGRAADLGPEAGNWLDVGDGTAVGPMGDWVVLPVTPRQAGLARLRLATGPDRSVEVKIPILP
jgi:hypothetical protein